MGSEERCRTCKWWTHPKREPTWGWCQLTRVSEGRPRFNRKALFFPGGSEYGAVRTHVDFGCIQWESKPLMHHVDIESFGPKHEMAANVLRRFLENGREPGREAEIEWAFRVLNDGIEQSIEADRRYYLRQGKS